MSNLLKTILGISLLFILSFGVLGQARTRKPVGKKPVKVVKKSTPAPETDAAAVPKKNERPEDSAPALTVEKANRRDDTNPAQDSLKKLGFVPNHFYNFAQPEFTIPSISVQHDDAGKGNISFTKQDVDEALVEPVQLSPSVLEKIGNALKGLNFLTSTENYQYEKDYSHLGNIKLRVKKNGLDRTVAFNYTTNKDAKVLADEYRKISNQAIWIFDINIARENQPLETPKLMDTLDSYIRRGELSDLVQMGPFITGISNDERLPLIARNHATRVLKEIEKQAKKK